MTFRKTKFARKDPKTGQVMSMWTLALTRRLHRLYVTQGLSVGKTAEKIGCSGMAVYNKLKLEGWVRPKLGVADKTQDFLSKPRNRKEILDLYQYRSADEIAKRYNLSLPTLINWLKHEGVFRYAAKDRMQVAVRSGVHGSIRRRDAFMLELLRLDASKLDPLKYAAAVRKLTNHVYKWLPEVLDPCSKRGGLGTKSSYALDHIFGIKAGTHRFVNGRWVRRKVNCPLHIMCHPANLRVVTSAYNNTLGRDHLFDNKDALLTRIREWNIGSMGDPFGHLFR